MAADDLPRLLFLLLLFAFVGAGLVVHLRGNVSRALQQAAIWALIFLGTIAAVGLWPSIRQTVLPRQAVVESAAGAVVTVPRQPDGHFYLALDVNGVPTRFAVDTGASEMVLSRRDAERAGIDTGSLSYLGTAVTANGPVRTARIFLDDVSLESIRDSNVPAVVTEGALDLSLVGMTYLDRFARIEIENGRLILTR